MSATNEQLQAKARGFITSIEKMKGAQDKYPSVEFAEDYNKLRSLVEETYPELKEILPPAVRIEPGGMANQPTAFQSFGEIHAYCEQIYQLLRAS